MRVSTIFSRHGVWDSIKKISRRTKKQDRLIKTQGKIVNINRYVILKKFLRRKKIEYLFGKQEFTKGNQIKV